MRTYGKRFLIMGLCLLLFSMFGCAKKGPSTITIQHPAQILGRIGESYDLAADIVTDGSEENPRLVYVSSDPAVAEVSADGIITAIGYGGATITVTSAADEAVVDTMDVLVYAYCGVYSAVKYIDAMGCDVRVRITLQEDGSFVYYRYPMYVDLNGGGKMSELHDSGTYTVSGGEFRFAGEFLGEYTLSFQLSADGQADLQGGTPTGGAVTQMQLLLNSTQDRGESGIYTGLGEAEDGTEIQYVLTLDSGAYTLTGSVNGSADVLSKGTYSFENNRIEFAAQEGVNFGANYDSARAVVEGTEIPVHSSSAEDAIAVTLTKN